jgi:hypothetical protein
VENHGRLPVAYYFLATRTSARGQSVLKVYDDDPPDEKRKAGRGQQPKKESEFWSPPSLQSHENGRRNYHSTR